MATTTKTDELVAHLKATTMTTTVGAGDAFVLPEKIRRAAGIVEGDMVYLEVLDEGEAGLHVRLGKIDPDQAWFWTPEWQAKEREADEDRLAGRLAVHHSDEEFLAALRDRAKRAYAR
jgi:bifunctional DNA-binding transcriptional regulator/antitoxin component of YhaV-PrlF toxin-antitoxin module